MSSDSGLSLGAGVMARSKSVNEYILVLAKAITPGYAYCAVASGESAGTKVLMLYTDLVPIGRIESPDPSEVSDGE